MTGPTESPLLFLDVDGPLIPFGASPGHRHGAAVPADQGNPLLMRLDPGIGARLMALGCHLVWATTWMEEANQTVAPRIGLPKLPVAHWPDMDADVDADMDADMDAGKGPRGLHWKTRRLVEWANGRPFIWVDDEIGAMDRQWVAAGHPGPSLLHRVDPARGLEEADFSALTGWLQTLAPR
ncbi:hypothetical protein E3E14_20000 [Streptomyces sp. ICN441]|uniref:HAD domain-containing protein n=1 Tax=Streptomyces sp. ICN441 TaxID=2558286 RepID=UPI00106DB146|nr:HAD domain-containing protein [Streptomyces sp. ICN441]TFE47706.1 hypothetical protein E3E14_20000 [Streptomyces sp. ICN441]